MVSAIINVGLSGLLLGLLVQVGFVLITRMRARLIPRGWRTKWVVGSGVAAVILAAVILAGWLPPPPAVEGIGAATGLILWLGLLGGLYMPLPAFDAR